MAGPRKNSKTRSTGKSSKKRSFHQELVLNRWMLGFFKAAASMPCNYDSAMTNMRALTKTAKQSSFMN